MTARCLGARSSRDLRWVPRLRRLLIEERIDLVHAHSPVAAAGARLAVRSIPRRRRPRMVTTDHNLWRTHVWPTRAADRLTAGFDDAHLAVSSAVRASMPARIRAATEVLRHGIDVAGVARFRADRADVRRELGVEDRLVVGTVANLRATKGWPDLLQAAKIVADEVDRATFLAVGQGPMESEIRRLRTELHLDEAVLLLGFRADAVRLMAGCDVFCLPSHDEGLPVAIMEALALGLPIVATDVGGIAELVTDGVNGRLLPPRRPDLLAAALVDLLVDEAARAAAGAASLARAGEVSADHAVRRIEEIYSSLVQR